MKGIWRANQPADAYWRQVRNREGTKWASGYKRLNSCGQRAHIDRETTEMGPAEGKPRYVRHIRRDSVCLGERDELIEIVSATSELREGRSGRGRHTLVVC